jgi:hypothetical protein
MAFLKNLYRKKKYGEPIVVVSGLPRAGTSMMMSMLEAGGIEILSDQVREEDQDNPKGYYEFEPIKDPVLDKQQSWLEEARGRGVKVISDLVKELSSDYFFKLIFMNRNLEEVVASQNKMLIRRGEPPQPGDDQKMMGLFEKHLDRVKRWIDQQPNFEALFVEYREVLEDPAQQAERIQALLQKELDLEKMTAVVDPQLYRNRKVG